MTSDFNLFRHQLMSMGTSNTFAGEDGNKIFELFADEQHGITYHIRTGQQCFGSPAERKRFHYVEFHGSGPLSGTLHVRVYIDGRYVCDGQSVTTETPNKVRRVNLPIAQSIGYAIDVEFSGDVPIRMMEFAVSPMVSTS